VPRRIRASLAGETVLDTTRALYVWEWPYYPQYYILVADVAARIPRERGREIRMPKSATVQALARLWHRNRNYSNG
jgi:Domain of unknown function (DUF427)